MTTGQQVTVKLYGGKTARRRVVAVKDRVIVICAEEEYVNAQREGRVPEGLGFPKADVLIEEDWAVARGANSEGR